MTENELYKLKFPVGEYTCPENITSHEISNWIKTIRTFPDDLGKLVSTLDEDSLNRRYRPGGWNVRQVVHHCADSHMNAFIRFKLSLTEDTPTIRPYFEDRWAKMEDYNKVDVNVSIQILSGLHHRWCVLLNSLETETLKKAFYHPESRRHFTLEETIGNYAWHCAHHYSHVVQALKLQFSD